MTGFYPTVQNEWTKLLAQKKLTIIFGIMGALILVISLIIKSFLPTIVITPILILNTLKTVILPLFVSMLTIDLFVGEKAHDTLKNIFLRPVSRINIYFAKLCAILFLVCSMLLVLWLEGTIISMFLNGFSLTMDMTLKSLLSYTLVILPLMLVSVAAAFLGQFLSTTGSTLVIAILITVGLNAASIFSNVIGKLSPTNYLNWYEPIVNGGTVSWSFWSVLLYMLSYYIILISISLLKFIREEA